MANFKEIVVRKPSDITKDISPEAVYWKDYEFPVTVKEFGAITHIDFNPVQPHQFAVTSSSKVQLFNPFNNQVERTFSRFKSAAYSASFRRHGRLLVAGGEDKLVQLLEVKSRSILRTFHGHEGPVHLTKFTSDGLRIFSGSDDKTVRCWDIADESELCVFSEHSDYVRCGDASKSSADLIVTGGYDHRAKLFDLRRKTSVISVDHGSPVESALFLPSGNIFLTAGGTQVKVWDVLAGGRLLTSFGNTHKTITSLWVHQPRGRILIGSLDRHVKIYDIASFRLLANLDYPAPVLCVGVSPSRSTLVVGMASGLLSIKQKKPEKEGESEEKKQERLRQKRMQMRYFNKTSLYVPQADDLAIFQTQKPHLAKFDRMLKRFQHSKALDAALEIQVRIRHPEATFSVINELTRRGTLKAALSGRDEKWLKLVLVFLRKHLSNPNYASVVVDVSNLLLDIYGPVMGESDDIMKALRNLQEGVAKELEYHSTLQEIQGMLDTILIASQANIQDGLTENDSDIMYQEQSKENVKFLPEVAPVS